MAAGEPSTRNYQTARLGPGRHDGPGEVVCVMELASMLSGERFSDRPAKVCPILGAILRAYNDNVDDRRRQDLYRFAADAVGTRGDFTLQRERAEVALGWAREVSAGAAGSGRRALRKLPEEPAPDAGPERIADYVVASIPRAAIFKAGKGRWSDDVHNALVALIERLIEMRSDVAIEPLLGEFVEPAADLPQQPTELSVQLPEPSMRLSEVSERLPEEVELPAEQAQDDRVHTFALPPDLPEPPLAHAHPVRRRKFNRRKLERSAEVLGAVTLVALACAASKRG
jgi:hypothetical protein